MKKVFIVSAKRTPVGSFLGTLKGQSPIDLGVSVVSSILKDCALSGGEVDEVIVGNVLPAGHGQNIARQIAIKSGIATSVPAYSINMLCDSGMKAVMNGYSSIASGQAELVLSGGSESMSQAPFIVSHKVRSGSKMGALEMSDYLLENLNDAFHGYHMGMTAENVAEMFSISRVEQDEFAISSQNKAIYAVDQGKFDEEVVPYFVKSRKGDVCFDKDEYPNRKTDLAKLSALKPAFKKNGSVTAGNASGLNDAASFTLLASEDAVKKYGLTPYCEIVSVAQTGLDPEVMGLGPVKSISKALASANLSITDIDKFEINEAFAAQALGVVKQLQGLHSFEQAWLNERLNVNGGAIALGHPLGASGNRIIVSLIHEMKRSGDTYGVASLCAGGGMGTAVVLKSVKGDAHE